MRLWLSGGTGFVGGRLAEMLRERGDHVVALARPTANTERLEAIGAEIAVGDITDLDSVRTSMEGCDGGFHVAAWYEVGVDDRERMFDINVGGTRNVLAAAKETGLPKLVYCSTCGALGPHEPGALPDETFENPVGLGSYYTESKYEAHRVVRSAAAEGLPVVTVLPGGIYGPNDPSVVGRILAMVVRGLMPVTALADGEFTFVHVDDVARGHILAFEKGTPGEEYVLGGEPATVHDVLQRAAVAAGRRPPKRSIPTGVLKAVAPVSGPFTRVMGFGPRFLQEAISQASGKSFAYSWEKARTRLGYRPMSLDEGIPPTVEWYRRQHADRKAARRG